MGNLAKFKTAAAVLAAVAALSACGSNGSTVGGSSQPGIAGCKASMVAFHTAAVAAGSKGLSGADQNKFQIRTIAACTKAEWLVAVKPYTGTDAKTDIVVTTGGATAKSVLAEFCQGIRGMRACS